jgi:hypothetical protein
MWHVLMLRSPTRVNAVQLFKAELPLFSAPVGRGVNVSNVMDYIVVT